MRRVLGIVFLLIATSPCWALRGIVVDQDGRPIPQAQVTIYQRGEGSGIRKLVAGPNGRYSVDLPEQSGKWAVLAAAKGYCHAVAQTRWDAVYDVRLVLFPGRTMVVKVVDERGQPVSGARVNLDFYGWERNGQFTSFDYDRKAAWAAAATTAASGRAVLQGMPDPRAGDFFTAKLHVVSAGQSPAWRTLTGGPIQSEIVMRVYDGSVLTGTVTLPGNSGPAPAGLSLFIRLQMSDRSTLMRSTTVRAGGRFEFDDLPSGQAMLMLGWPAETNTAPLATSVAQWAMPAKRGIDLAPGKAVNIQVSLADGALIRGLVQTADGTPLSRAVVAVAHPGRPDEEVADRLTTGASGRFEIRVAPGTTTVWVVGVDQNGTVGLQNYQPVPYASSVTVDTVDGGVADVTLVIGPVSRAGTTPRQPPVYSSWSERIKVLYKQMRGRRAK